jgi:hypothetical protein
MSIIRVEIFILTVVWLSVVGLGSNLLLYLFQDQEDPYPSIRFFISAAIQCSLVVWGLQVLPK